MKLSTEVYTNKVEESRIFYETYFDFTVKQELEGFVVLQHKINQNYELMFCEANSPFVDPIFHPEFQGKGILFQMKVDDVEKEYQRLKNKRLPIAVELVDDGTNGYHFTVIDPNGILLDIVTYN